jgi:transcriptional regulator with XRE-family HTH domain
MKPEQCRAARALLGWSQSQLCKAAKVARATLAEFEAGKRAPYQRTLDDIRNALEVGGVIFVAENGEGPGARLRKTTPRVNDEPVSAKRYSAWRLNSDRVPVHEWQGLAADAASALNQLGEHLKAMFGYPGFNGDDVVTFEGPDGSTIKVGTVTEMIAGAESKTVYEAASDDFQILIGAKRRINKKKN